jgi:hypothetical protein
MLRHCHFEGSFMVLEPVYLDGIVEGWWVVAGGREGVSPSDWFFEYDSLEAAGRAFDGFELELLDRVVAL